jgi:hypothetical protein
LFVNNQDWESRWNETKLSILYYVNELSKIKNVDVQLEVVDCSIGLDVSKLFSDFSKSIKMESGLSLKFTHVDIDFERANEYGKGWSELNILNSYVNSLSSEADFDFFVKISARYKIVNIIPLINELLDAPNIYSIYAAKSDLLRRVSTIIFGFSVNKWGRFFSIAMNNVRDKSGQTLERVTYDVLHKEGNICRLSRFPIFSPDQHSGSTGAHYSGPKHFLRKILYGYL